MNLIKWILFYEFVYELDEVERPAQLVIDNDERLDMWYDSYRSQVKKRLLEYHKNDTHVDRGVPKASKVFK